LTQFSVSGTTPTGSIALGPSDFQVTFTEDGAPVDNESLFREDQIKAETLVSMVLDGSFSMTQQVPPAFEPMKAAARQTGERLQQVWEERAGDFFYSWSWYDDFIYVPADPYSWSQISQIPAPQPGNATRMYGAIARMLDRHVAWRTTPQPRASGPNRPLAGNSYERHFMIVLTDGKDNVSLSDNSNINSLISAPFGYRKIGYVPVRRDPFDPNLPVDDFNPANPPPAIPPVAPPQVLTQRLEALPWLTVYVLGLGSDVNLAELQRIASSGRGQVYSGDPTSVTELFKQVLSAVSSLSNQGLLMPIVTVRPNVRIGMKIELRGKPGVSVSKSFRINAGPGAAFIGFD
jgi:hypothetical protein